MDSCKECKREMVLDHVSIENGEKVLYYTCINPRCRQKGKAYTANGTETQSKIKDKE